VFEQLPILADALLDTYCDNEDIIQHCQGTGTQVRSYWGLISSWANRKVIAHD
jgi:hypothetical protein